MHIIRRSVHVNLALYAQAPEERSYHIFYQLCASAWENCPPEFADFELEQCTAYKYISGGNSPEVRLCTAWLRTHVTKENRPMKRCRSS
jgi:hypothetical protein